MDPLMTEMQSDISELPPHVLRWEGSRYVVGLAESEYMEALASYEYGQASMVRLANAHLGLWQSWLAAVDLYELVHRGRP